MYFFWQSITVKIVFTNKQLAKIGYVLHNTCTFCKVETETIYHLFYECPFTLLFWENFENFEFWFVLSGKGKNSR